MHCLLWNTTALNQCAVWGGCVGQAHQGEIQGLEALGKVSAEKIVLQDGHLEKSLKGHGHWVNTLALSTEAALRTGAFDHTGSAPAEPEEAKAKALQRFLPPSHSTTRHMLPLHTSMIWPLQRQSALRLAPTVTCAAKSIRDRQSRAPVNPSPGQVCQAGRVSDGAQSSAREFR